MLSSHRDILKEVDASHRQEISPEWVTGGHAEGTPVVRARNRHRYYLATPFARERERVKICVYWKFVTEISSQPFWLSDWTRKAAKALRSMSSAPI